MTNQIVIITRRPFASGFILPVRCPRYNVMNIPMIMTQGGWMIPSMTHYTFNNN